MKNHSSNRCFYVYEHWRPDKDVCFYVGKGKGGRAYLSRRGVYYCRVVAKLRRIGMCVEVRMVESGLLEKEAFALEIERIKFWRSIGVSLVNKTDGGDGISGFKHSAECRRKIGLKHLGRKHTEQSRKRMSLAQTKRMKSEKVRENLRIKCSGWHHTKKAKAIISKTHKGKPKGPFTREHRENISKGQLGRKLSEAHKAKIGAKMKGRVFTEEWLKKISDAQKGKPRPYVRFGPDGRFLRKVQSDG